MPLLLEDINSLAKEKPSELIRLCDEHYRSQLVRAAEIVAGRMADNRIVFMAGPSSSGKTTAAHKLADTLKKMGVNCSAVSLDDYYMDVAPGITPLDEKGNYDFESPLCLDLDLLNEHFNRLSNGELVNIPTFDFVNKQRSRTVTRPLKLEKNEIVIFEGIHALGPYIAGRYPAGTGIYVSVAEDIFDASGEPRFYASRMRLARRMVRDYLTRGASPEYTLILWDNVRKNEKVNIMPYAEKAQVKIDTVMPYEVGVMKNVAMPALLSVPKDANRYDQIQGMIERYEDFVSIDPELVPADSMLREFIGEKK